MGWHGHPRHTSAHTVGRPRVARPHTRAHGTAARHRHEMSPKQKHEVTNTDSVIRAHGTGACHGHTADDKIADGRLDVRLAVVVAVCCKVPEHRLNDNGVANVS